MSPGSGTSVFSPRLRIRAPSCVDAGSTDIDGGTFDETKEEKGLGMKEDVIAEEV